MMSTEVEEEEIQMDPEVFETNELDFEDDEDQEMEPESQGNPLDLEQAAVQVQTKKREPLELAREPGKSLLPISRVQKIIKADKEIPIVAKEATFLISLATEEFIKRLCEAGQHVAHREKRSTVQHKDLATVVRRADEFLFLEEIMPWTSTEAPAKRTKPKAAVGGKTTMLDQFVIKKVDEEEELEEDVIMNEDGTMYAGNAQVEYET